LTPSHSRRNRERALGPKKTLIPSKHGRGELEARGFKFEIIQQLFERYGHMGVEQLEHLRPTDNPEDYSPGQKVLQFRKGPQYYRMCYVDLPNELPYGVVLPPVWTLLITIITDGSTAPIPNCPVIELDNNWDLPEEKGI
jgi:hypothetical protein